MKTGDKVKFIGESIYGIKDQIGKIAKELSFFGLVSTDKWWEVDFNGHIGTYLCFETDLKRVYEQLCFKFR